MLRKVIECSIMGVVVNESCDVRMSVYFECSLMRFIRSASVFLKYPGYTWYVMMFT